MSLVSRRCAPAVLALALLLTGTGRAVVPAPDDGTDLRLAAGRVSGAYHGALQEVLDALARLVDLRVQLSPTAGATPIAGVLSNQTPQESLGRILEGFDTVIVEDAAALGAIEVYVLGRSRPPPSPARSAPARGPRAGVGADPNGGIQPGQRAPRRDGGSGDTRAIRRCHRTVLGAPACAVD